MRFYLSNLVILAFTPIAIATTSGSNVELSNLASLTSFLRLLSNPINAMQSICENFKAMKQANELNEAFNENIKRVTCTVLEMNKTVSVCSAFNGLESYYGLALTNPKNNCKTQEARFSEKYIPPTPIHNKINGLEFGDLKSARDNLKHGADIRDKVAGSCCNSNVECLTAFRNITFKLCDPLPAMKSPQKPDKCADGAFYNHYDLDRVGKEMEFQTYLSSLVKLGAEGDKNLDTQRALVKNRKIESGEVWLSAYGRRSLDGFKFYDEDNIIRHELGHACSYIQLQLQLKNSSSVADFSVAADRILHIENISSNDQLKESFKKQLKTTFPMEKEELFNCILDQVEVLKNETCSVGELISFYEEYVSSVFSYLTDDSFNKEKLYSGCHSTIDRLHLNEQPVIDCLAMHSAKFQESLKKGMECIPAQNPFQQ